MFKVGGIIPTSLVDYPKKVAMTIFLRGCNLRCNYCHNKDLLSSEGDNMSEEELFTTVVNRLRYIDAVVFSGGEATIHNGHLKNLIKKLKEKTRLLVKIDTNGMNPEFVRDMKDFVDYWAVDIKDKGSLRTFKGSEDPHSVLMRTKEELSKVTGIIEFRTTIPNGFNVTDLMELNQYVIPGKLWYLQKSVSTPSYISEVTTEDMEALVKDAPENVRLRY